MGWHPVSPEYTNFPNPSKPKDYDVKLKRGSSTRHDGNKPQGRKKTRPYYVALRAFGEQSRAMGYFNGIRISTKGAR
ncbi:hypothetical protein SAMN05444169_7631 [Bradyrhizobium erythrophlei]|uniref:Uncharacterized protein n=2 Tax=Bradyrhizobium erythrophlei TaxID=1437360 RepID=A0A1M5TAJ4_9BRAD|nr:hypothetical protein SAMN05444169_7631 [Bradyrhizobium erythrophlei]